MKRPLPFPRPRGGDPDNDTLTTWTGYLFPAHAGVILLDKMLNRRRMTFPRPRGGDPHGVILVNVGRPFSPPTRG